MKMKKYIEIFVNASKHDIRFKNIVTNFYKVLKANIEAQYLSDLKYYINCFNLININHIITTISFIKSF